MFHNANVDVLDVRQGDLVFEGAHFSHFDSHGFMTNGTVNRFTQVNQVPGITITYSDFTVSGARLQHIFQTGDNAAFTKLFFGGDDTITFNGGGSEASGYAGDDTMIGLGGNDAMLGGAGNDMMKGHGGADYLEGDAGVDRLTGGHGGDQFAFGKVTDSNSAATDTITDLANGDKIALSSIDADRNAGGNQAFHIVPAFTGAGAELVLKFDSLNHRTVIRGDVNGDKHADLVIIALGDHTDFTNFIF